MGFTIQDNILKFYEGRDYELSLPDNITEINSCVFSHKNLLKSIQLGSRLVKIGSSAFSGCESLKAIEIPESVTYIGESCFRNCTSLERVVIPEGVTHIEEYTFCGCSSLNEVFLPSTIEYIGEAAFKNCKNLVNIHFKALPTKIGNDVFKGCTRLYEDMGMVIVGQTIYGYSGKEGVLKIPSTVTSIAPEAFRDNKELIDVEIPGSVEVIPARAFMGCSNLKKVVLNEGLREIDWIAFHSCKSIEEIIIPESVTTIGNGAFEFCENLKHVKLPSKINSISESMFSCCKALENMELPISVKNIMRSAFSGTGIRELDLSNVAFIDMDAFSGSKIERIVLGEKFQTPHSHMLNRCFALKYLYITDTVTEVDGWGPEFAEQTFIPFIHVSSKLIKGLDDENKLNAVSTFIQNQSDYSEEGRKSWLTYIKRYKVNLLKLCIDGARDDLYHKMLKMVSLSEANVAEIKEYIKGSAFEGDKRFCIDELVPAAAATKKSVKAVSGSVIAQLIASIPKSASAIKKVYLLEAATFFGSYEELQAVIEKYQSFEFTKGAVLIAFQLKQLKKMSLLLGLNKYFCNGDYSSLKGKYGYFVNRDFADVITNKAFSANLYNLDAIENFIKNTLGAQGSSITVAYGTDATTKMLQEIVAHPNVTTHSNLLHRAIMNRNFSMVSDLLEIGCAIDFRFIPQDTGYILSRILPTLGIEQALLVLKQYTAPAGIEKIKLDDSAIYSEGTPFLNPDVFAAVCSGYNIERFTKKKLFEFAASLPEPTNLQYLFDNGYVKATKPLIFSAIEEAKNSNNLVIEQWLIRFFENKFGDVEIVSKKVKSLTPLERIKQDWSYAVMDDEIYIKSYKGNSCTVTVPSIIAGKPVTQIDYDAFSPEAPRTSAEARSHRNEIEELTLPTGFTGFYSDLLWHNRKTFGKNFKRFVIPEDSCNYSYKLLGELLNIADVENVTRAGEFIEEGDIVYTKDYSVVIGTRKNNHISKYVMPNSVQFIMKGIWNGFADLEELTITSQVQVYGENSYASLGYQFEKMKKLKRVTVGGMDVFPGDLLSYAETVEEVFIHEGVKKIEKFAFDTCKSLRKLTIPRSCIEIGDYIFPRVFENRWPGSSKYVGLPEGFMLYCYEGSYAEQYAKEENVPFTCLKENKPN